MPKISASKALARFRVLDLSRALRLTIRIAAMRCDVAVDVEPACFDSADYIEGRRAFAQKKSCEIYRKMTARENTQSTF